jgi:hypothetical protein
MMSGVQRPGLAGAAPSPSTSDPAPGSSPSPAPSASPSGSSGPSRRTTLLRAGGLALLLAGPLVVALVAVYRPAWHPLSDVSLIEMRVRDVGSGRTPLIGVYGRFEGYGQTGSHPGPLLFYVLWPVYTLAGGDGWALQLAGVALALAASAVAVWLGRRRGGWPLALGVTAVLVLLTRALGAERIAEPWNPNVAAVWWVVFLLAVWAVLCDDLPVLPVAVFAGTLCVQSHVGYALLVAALGGATALWLGYGALRRRRAAGSPSDEVPGRRLVRWAVLAVGVGALLWLPPLIDQAVNDPGNLSVLVEGFRNPTVEQVPFGDAVEAWFAHLDASELVTRDLMPRGAALPGALTLAAWAATAVLAWRRRAGDLVRLHAVAGVAALVGLLSMSRVFGPLWPYLTLWAWGTTALMVLAAAATVLRLAEPDAELAARRPRPRPRPRAAVAGLASVAVVAAGAFAVDAAGAEMPDERLSVGLDRMADAVAERLEADPYGCGDGCRYLVTWADPIYLGSQGYGMVVELERRGIDAAARPQEAIGVRDHRVIDPADADATIHVAVTDEAIDGARAQPGAELVAYVEPYGEAAREEHEALRARTAEALGDEGYGDLAAEVADPAHQAIVPRDEGMSGRLEDLVDELNSVYRPSAVFLLPPAAGG